jgi:hypothetical protein
VIVSPNHRKGSEGLDVRWGASRGLGGRDLVRAARFRAFLAKCGFLALASGMKLCFSERRAGALNNGAPGLAGLHRYPAARPTPSAASTGGHVTAHLSFRFARSATLSASLP